MNEENVILSVETRRFTKKEFIDLINETFPDEEMCTHGSIVALVTTKMCDKTVNQAICFGKMLK